MPQIPVMPKNEDVHPNDLMNSKKTSAADEYYRFMLRQAKIQAFKDQRTADNDKFLDDTEVAALQSVSLKEKVELKTLGRLYQLDDHSAEYLQVKAITGGHTREEIASKLADRYMEKIQVEEVLDRFTAPTTNKTKIATAMTASRTKYDAFTK
jgi:hypothetical protein